MSYLHIFVRYIRLDRGVLKHKDEIRVSFTSLPQHQKDHFSIPSSRLSLINHEFIIDFEDTLEEILFTIRRKSYINGDPILGKCILKSSQIEKTQTVEKEISVLTHTERDPEHFIKIGQMGIKYYFDSINSFPKKITSYNSTPTLSDLPPLGEDPSKDSKKPIFPNLFKHKNKNFVEIDDDDQNKMAHIASSKSDFFFGDPA